MSIEQYTHTTVDTTHKNDDGAEGGAACVRSEKLRRLVADTAGYLGQDTVPIEEVRLQAQAHGYCEEEFNALLADDGLAGARELVAPERDGSVFGEVWAGGLPPSNTAKFKDWLQSKADSRITEYDDGEYQFRPEHSYSRKAENEKYRDCNNVDRFYNREYDTFTTVMLTFVAERQPGESAVDRAERLYPDAVKRKLRYELNKRDLQEGWAGVRILAPKHPARLLRPNSAKPESATHAHTGLWLPGEVSRDVFKPVIKKHIEEVAGATEVNHPLEKSITVQVHHSEECGPVVSKIDGKLGGTTALPKELGKNLPMLKCKFDARGCPDYITEWAAQMSCGNDGNPTTKGVNRFQPLGRFGELGEGTQYNQGTESTF